ncbi:MAG: hypothetical protein KDB14_03780 [Planctomycetales bacterium]|nr:hypothetical protein [Planctomycetales bacterium]
MLRRFREGEQDAATAIYLRYAKRLQSLAATQTSNDLAVRIDPEGVVQSVFRTFFRRAAEGQYEIPDGEELWKLFLVMALNKIRSKATHHRAAKRDVRQTTAIDTGADLADEQEQQAYLMLKLTMDDLLEELSESQRMMVLLRIEGYEVAEIATRTKRSKRSVERLLQGFRQKLAKVIAEEQEDQ